MALLQQTHAYIAKRRAQGYYKWRANPVSQRDYDDAHVINQALDVHHDDPGFGYRFISDELAAAGVKASENRIWRLCSMQKIFSAHSRKRGRSRKPGPPVHDDLVRRRFGADGPDRLWFVDITEHPTSQGKLYLCAVKDAYSSRIVGYSMDSRMTSQLAVAALDNVLSRRQPLDCVVHSDRGSQFRSFRYSKRMFSTSGAGRLETSYVSRSLPGSSVTTTGVVANVVSAS